MVENVSAHVAGGLVGDIGMAVVAADFFAIIAARFKQPTLLAYLIGGLVIGPVGLGLISSRESIDTISEIGLVLLLFMIGLEINLKTLAKSGTLIIIAGLLQFPLCVGFAWTLLTLIGGWGVELLQGPAAFYLAVAAGISSTLIVVKLLYEKHELDTLAGRLSIGILVFQDLWAIVILTLQPNLPFGHGGGVFELSGLLLDFFAAGLLVVIAFFFAKFILPRIFSMVGKMPEVMLIVALAWCFLIGGIGGNMGKLFPFLGLPGGASVSIEMGALIAGVAISTFPYSLEIVARVTTLRDFFVTLFFIGLGMKIPLPESALLPMAALGVATIVLASRFFILAPILAFLGAGRRMALITSINLSQVSEFALVITAIGYSLGHIGDTTVTLVIFSFLITSIVSTYFIQFNYQIQTVVGKTLDLVGLRGKEGAKVEEEEGHSRSIIILGFHQTASSLLCELEEEDPAMLKELLIVDFNPLTIKKLKSRGVEAIYGDIGHLDTLHHAGLSGASVIVSTIPDTLLKGTDNIRLVKNLKQLAPDAKLIMNCDEIGKIGALYDAGADIVYSGRVIVAKTLLPIMQAVVSDRLEALHHSHITSPELKDRDELL